MMARRQPAVFNHATSSSRSKVPTVIGITPPRAKAFHSALPSKTSVPMVPTVPTAPATPIVPNIVAPIVVTTSIAIAALKDVPSSTAPIQLSILIPTLPVRLQSLSRMLFQLHQQTHERFDVEILTLLDNRKRTTGQKRNDLISLAKGTWIAFVDDDDRISDQYVTKILESIAKNSDADVLTFEVIVNGHGPPKITRFDVHFSHENHGPFYKRKPNHIMVWKRAIASSIPFQNRSYGEDTSWAEAMAPKVKKQAHIGEVLYFYDIQRK